MATCVAAVARSHSSIVWNRLPFPLTATAKSFTTNKLPPKIKDETTRLERKELRYKKFYVIPVKYKPSKSKLNDAEYYMKRTKIRRKAMWSNEEVTHPLEESPLHDNYPIPLPDGGLRYYGFDYYPQDPNNVETIPKEEISKLFMVRKCEIMSGIEWWHKNTLERLGFTENRCTKKVVIIKNVPEMNKMLYSVKHLVEITPIKLPENLPEDADPAHCMLTEEGEFLYNPTIEVADLEEPEELVKKKLSRDQIDMEGKQKWRNPWETTT